MVKFEEIFSTQFLNEKFDFWEYLRMIGFCNAAADKFLVYLSFYYVMYHS